MSVKDVFHLGSNTKAMTSTVLAMLIEDGVFTWDTPLFTAFPDRTKNMDPGHQHTTMAMLTSHRSGLSDDWLSSDVALMTRLYDSSLSSSEGRQLVMDGAFSQPPVSTPGTQFIYTNIGYIIIGHLMEQVTGKSWENLLRERLFDPLKMMDCGFGVCPQATPEAVDNPWPHMQTPEGPLPIFPDRQADNPPAFAPAASVHCTMSDYAKFLQLQMDGFNGKATKIVSKESFDRLHGKLPNQAYTSGGWIRINDDGVHGTCLMHSGSNTLNYATAYLMPASDTAFMGMTNVGGDAAANATLTAITDLLTKALLP